MSDALKDHKGSASIGSPNFINFRFADHDDIIDNTAEVEEDEEAEEEEDADGIVKRLDTTGSKYKIEIEPRCEKTGLRGFRPGPTQTGLYNSIRWLEA